MNDVEGEVEINYEAEAEFVKAARRDADEAVKAMHRRTERYLREFEHRGFDRPEYGKEAVSIEVE